MMNARTTTTLSFEIYRGYAYGISEALGEGIKAEIRISPRVNGYMLIGAYTFDIVNGACMPDLRMLEEGDHKVCIYADGETVRADGIRKLGRKISLIPKGEGEQRELRAEVIALKRELTSISDTLEKMREKIDGTSVL